MFKNKFEVGETVFVKNSDGSKPEAEHKFARVIKILTNHTEPAYLLEFNVNIKGHNGQGLTPSGHCWALPERCLAHEGEAIENPLYLNGIPVMFDPLMQPGFIEFRKGQILKIISREPNYAAILRSNKKETNMLKKLSSQLKTLIKGDEDAKALIEAGVLDESLNIVNFALLLDMLGVIFKKELAEEARKRIEEAKEQ